MDDQETWGFHGSDCSEQNHISLLVHLNDVHRRESQHCKDTHTLVKNLLHRDKKHVNKRNNILHDQKIQIYVWMEQFNDRAPQCNSGASTVLSVNRLLMFEKSVQRIVDYQVDYNSD